MPATHYGVFKQATEASARVYYAESGISSVGLRPWTVYGAGRDTGLTADPSLALKAAVLGEKFKIRISGRMNFQYVEDVAETVLACLFASLEGAYAFNLAGDVIETEDFIAELERLRPQAKGLITAEGAPVPVAPLMDDSALREKIPNLPRTPLPEGIAKTLAIFERLKREGRLR